MMRSWLDCPTQPPDWCVPYSGKRYKVTKGFTWEIGAKGSGLFIFVPSGFVFDGSVPWYLRWLISPHNPRYLLAFALHDYALHELGWDRESAAAPFSEALRACKVDPVRRFAMAVSVFIYKWK